LKKIVGVVETVD